MTSLLYMNREDVLERRQLLLARLRANRRQREVLGHDDGRLRRELADLLQQGYGLPLFPLGPAEMCHAAGISAVTADELLRARR
jgi:hypothetical protein